MRGEEKETLITHLFPTTIYGSHWRGNPSGSVLIAEQCFILTVYADHPAAVGVNPDLLRWLSAEPEELTRFC